VRNIIPSIFVFGCLSVLLVACDDPKDSDQVQQQQQETILAEGTAQIGMPAIKNFRERKLLKDILELRDQDGLVTYTYVMSEVTGKLVYLGQTIGYGIPYATQFTNPQKVVVSGTNDSKPGYSRLVIPQADPNGLFSPASAEGTWILMLDPKSGKTLPQYIEPRILTFTFKLDDNDPRLAISGVH